MPSAENLGATERIRAVGILISIGVTRFSLEFIVKVGDLVRHRVNQQWIGVITHREITRHGEIYRIDWTDGCKGVCWDEEVEVAN